jgi:hypothetical protein
MWWIFGLINVVITLLFTWFFDKYIKEDMKWTLDDKCSFGTLLFLSLIGGYIVTLLFASLLIYLLIDFIRLIKK